MQRACLQDIADDLTHKRGYDVVIDFASGLPTQDHIHTVVKPGTLVIYSDIDPVVVEFAKEILKGAPDTYIFQSDARHPETLLSNPQVLELLQGRRDVALVLWGLSSFLNDAELNTTMQAVYNWSGPRATMVFNAQGTDINTNDPAVMQVMALYERMGVKLHARTLSQHHDLVRPWRADEQGFVSLLNWHGCDSTVMTPEDLQMMGSAGGGYGAYLVK
ncbi:MAG: SAM-dependent methyltransferase [Chloroflexi bacterium]|nr:SAM-dependent methyltransferase [Chloroflexota bacterium]